MAKQKADDKHTIRAGVRNLIQISGSHYLSLPREFIEAHNLKPGDALPIAYNGVLTITPIPKIELKEEALIPRKEILLPYPGDADMSDEGRFSLALAKNYRDIHDYIKQEKPDWEEIEVNMETVIRDGKRYFLVTKIMSTIPREE